MRVVVIVLGVSLLASGCGSGGSVDGCDRLAAAVLVDERAREVRAGTEVTERHTTNSTTGACIVVVTSAWTGPDGVKSRDTRVIDAKWRNVLLTESEREGQESAYSCLSGGQPLTREACAKRVGELARESVK